MSGYESRLHIEVFPHVYPPGEDSHFLLEHTRVHPGDSVLELCCGCGLIGLNLAQTAGEVVATDINPFAIENTRHNARINGIGNVKAREGDLYAPVQGQVFDLIVANPPYVPTPPNWQEQDIIEVSWNAGPGGRKLINCILDELPQYLAPKGRFLMVQSSLADIPQTLKQLNAMQLQPEIIASKWLELGPVSHSRYNWLKEQAIMLSAQSELLVVIEARQSQGSEAL